MDYTALNEAAQGMVGAFVAAGVVSVAQQFGTPALTADDVAVALAGGPKIYSTLPDGSVVVQ